MAQRRRPTLLSLQSNPPAKRCWDRHSAKWNGTYPLARPICVVGMANEDADAEQETCCRDNLAHSLSPCLEGESSIGWFPDDFVELAEWFRRAGRHSGRKQLHRDRELSHRFTLAGFISFAHGKIKPPSVGLARTGVIGDEIIKPIGHLPAASPTEAALFHVPGTMFTPGELRRR